MVRIWGWSNVILFAVIVGFAVGYGLIAAQYKQNFWQNLAVFANQAVSFKKFQKHTLEEVDGQQLGQLVSLSSLHALSSSTTS